MDELLLLGAGPHAKVVADIIEQCNQYKIAGVIDKESQADFMGLPFLGDDDCLQALYDKGFRKAFVAIGDNKIRRKVYEKAAGIGFEMVNVISPYAIISPHAQIDKGVAVMPGAVINTYTHIGDGCIVNTNSSVDHDGNIGSFVHIAPGAAIAGMVTIGDNTFCGLGSRIIDGITVGSNVIIGAGGTVINNIGDNLTVVGVPAKQIIKQRR